MEKNYKEPRIKCDNCGSVNVEIHCGMFLDRFVCSNCGHEWYE